MYSNMSTKYKEKYLEIKSKIAPITDKVPNNIIKTIHKLPLRTKL
jgi:hypothetical protein